MGEVIQRPSATIHAFPSRGRFAIRRDDELRVASGIVTGAWYHEEAIQEAAREDNSPKRQ